jgi:hypothetical protein
MIVKDKRLDALRERNIFDGDQLDLVIALISSMFLNFILNLTVFFSLSSQELQAFSDKCAFDLSVKEELVKKLEIQYKRLGIFWLKTLVVLFVHVAS